MSAITSQIVRTAAADAYFDFEADAHTMRGPGDYPDGRETFEGGFAAGVSWLRDHFSDEVGGDVKAALEGDSNDAEHETLYQVAEYFDIEHGSPYDDNNEED